MKDFYQVLGVTRLASSREIKIAYRKLAIQYHPDRNQDSHAEFRIKEINEAYHTLRDKDRRWLYDQKFYRPVAVEKSVVVQTSSAFSNPFTAPPTAPPPAPRRSNEHAIREMVGRHLAFVRNISVVSIVFCLFLLFDYTLPFAETNEQITGKHINMVPHGVSTFRSNMIITNYITRLRLPADLVEQLKTGDQVTIMATRLVGVPISLRSGLVVQKSFNATIYRNFLFLPAILLITTVLTFFYRGKAEFRFTLGVINFFMLFMSVLFLFSHKVFL